MRVAKNKNGEKRFNPNENIPISQILQYFSRLSAMRKTSSKDINDDDLHADLLNNAKMVPIGQLTVYYQLLQQVLAFIDMYM